MKHVNIFDILSTTGCL